MNATRIERPYPMGEKDLARFMVKHAEDANGCWVWTAAKNHKGYGSFFHGKTVPSHLVSYKHFVGEISPDKEIDHLCNVRSCVNPEHLDQVTHAENLARIVRPNRENRSHCNNGHLMTPENIFVDGVTDWSCRTCSRESKDRWGKRRVICQVCRGEYSARNLSTHIKKMHK